MSHLLMHIESLLINSAEELDIAMLMCNLIGYSKNYSKRLLLYRITQEIFHLML